MTAANDVPSIAFPPIRGPEWIAPKKPEPTQDLFLSVRLSDALTAIAALLIGTAVAVGLWQDAERSTALRIEARAAAAGAELPREWRFQPTGVRYEQMYMKR